MPRKQLSAYESSKWLKPLCLLRYQKYLFYTLSFIKKYNSNRHETTRHIIYSEVFHSQRIQYDSARIQRHYHNKEHSGVKLQSILRYSSVVV
mgnify:CR=1 FL=1